MNHQAGFLITFSIVKKRLPAHEVIQLHQRKNFTQHRLFIKFLKKRIYKPQNKQDYSSFICFC
jgi:hypothetical protein